MNKTFSSRGTKPAPAARSKARKLADDLIDDVAETTSDMRTRAQRGATKARAAVADRAEELSDDLHVVGDRAAGLTRRVADRVAEGVSRMSDDLRGRSLTDVLDGAQGFAKRNPAVVVAGALFAGLVLSRLARSSDRNRRG